MANRIISVTVFVAMIFCLGICSVYAQEASSVQALETKTVDINKDGKPDVTYYHDGKNVTKAEADTNYDGKPDVTVYTEDGKFKSAEADTNYDGKTDKEFTDVKKFNEWLNKDNAEFRDSLTWDDWSSAKLFRF